MPSHQTKPAGSLWLIQRFGLQVLPYWRKTWILEKGARRLIERDGVTIEHLPQNQDPGEDVFSQLEFTLKREGLHLELLRKVLPLLELADVERYVRSRPTGRYARIIWYLYEEFTSNQLTLPDLKTGNYFDLLDPEIYVTGSREKQRRQRINCNLLGDLTFSPMVRSAGLGVWNETELKERCAQIVAETPVSVFERAIRYLYAKESKSSHEIERETPDHRRAEKFIGLLEQAWHRSFLDKPALVELHQAIVDARYANKGWRNEIDEQIYVGETLTPGMERVHFIAPKPGDLEELMNGFLKMALRITRRERRVQTSIGPVTQIAIPPVPTLVAAAVISFTFDFLHPFSDGNGRIHRFLLHHVLARNHFGPQGIILPVSAVILHRPREYDQALESFSKPLMKVIDYEMDDRQRITVTNSTADYYRYIDCTELTRITIDFVKEAIETELPAELQFLLSYDEIREGMRDLVDLPDRVADLFIKLCRQNDGYLSKSKHNLPEFSPLTATEIEALENVVRTGLNFPGPAQG